MGGSPLAKPIPQSDVFGTTPRDVYGNPPGGTEEIQYDLHVSTSLTDNLDGSHSRLDGANIVPTVRIYLWPETGADSVDWQVDAVPVNSDSAAPFVLGDSGQYTFTEGPHQVIAQVRRPSQTLTITVDITVQDTAPSYEGWPKNGENSHVPLWGIGGSAVMFQDQVEPYMTIIAELGGGGIQGFALSVASRRQKIYDAIVAIKSKPEAEGPENVKIVAYTNDGVVDGDVVIRDYNQERHFARIFGINNGQHQALIRDPVNGLPGGTSWSPGQIYVNVYSLPLNDGTGRDFKTEMRTDQVSAWDDRDYPVDEANPGQYSLVDPSKNPHGTLLIDGTCRDIVREVSRWALFRKWFGTITAKNGRVLTISLGSNSVRTLAPSNYYVLCMNSGDKNGWTRSEERRCNITSTWDYDAGDTTITLDSDSTYAKVGNLVAITTGGKYYTGDFNNDGVFEQNNDGQLNPAWKGYWHGQGYLKNRQQWRDAFLANGLDADRDKFNSNLTNSESFSGSRIYDSKPEHPRDSFYYKYTEFPLAEHAFKTSAGAFGMSSVSDDPDVGDMRDDYWFMDRTWDNPTNGWFGYYAVAQFWKDWFLKPDSEAIWGYSSGLFEWRQRESWEFSSNPGGQEIFPGGFRHDDWWSMAYCWSICMMAQRMFFVPARGLNKPFYCPEMAIWVGPRGSNQHVNMGTIDPWYDGGVDGSSHPDYHKAVFTARPTDFGEWGYITIYDELDPSNLMASTLDYRRVMIANNFRYPNVASWNGKYPYPYKPETQAYWDNINPDKDTFTWPANEPGWHWEMWDPDTYVSPRTGRRPLFTGTLGSAGDSAKSYFDGASYAGGTDHICFTGLPIIAFERRD